MGYLVCEKCGGYYELQSGETPNDFDGGECECGGKLKYTNSITKLSSKPSDNENEAEREHPTEKFCQECGSGNRADAPFCYQCGNSFHPQFTQQKEISRTIELVLGIIGGIFGLLGGIFAVLFGIFASEITGLGISAILASIVGMGSAAYVLQNPKWGGIILIVCAVWLLISISLFGVLGAVLLGLAGLLAILRK